jgi:hypothetical protein
MVVAGLVPATPIILARPCPVIGVAGTSPAMTRVMGRLTEERRDKRKARHLAGL